MHSSAHILVNGGVLEVVFCRCPNLLMMSCWAWDDFIPVTMVICWVLWSLKLIRFWCDEISEFLQINRQHCSNNTAFLQITGVSFFIPTKRLLIQMFFFYFHLIFFQLNFHFHLFSTYFFFSLLFSSKFSLSFLGTKHRKAIGNLAA